MRLSSRIGSVAERQGSCNRNDEEGKCNPHSLESLELEAETESGPCHDRLGLEPIECAYAVDDPHDDHRQNRVTRPDCTVNCNEDRHDEEGVGRRCCPVLSSHLKKREEKTQYEKGDSRDAVVTRLRHATR